MKFTAIIAAVTVMAFASAAKPVTTTSDVVTVTLPSSSNTAAPTVSPTSGVGTATETATMTVTIATTITVGIPTVITTTAVGPSSTPTPTTRGNAGNAVQAPVKAMMALGGVAALAQFL
ncbi:hypothetical protein BGZ95_010931 [Linnemannia exigua]|uniref:Uncharacterized protein n=1 Tax=Linnemannia exigua TaxID=604196 RepID=A0AAD4DB68_9FUNG|nr:hypothetical protein BGZ95_010931 [Linnemannia exigua]